MLARTKVMNGNVHPSMVETSPASTPASFAFRKRRRIFPDRVLGRDATNSSEDGVAIGPSSLRTCSMRAADNASDATHEYFDRLALHGVRDANGCSLRHCRTRHQRAFHLRRADAVSGHVKNIIVASDHGDVTIFVFYCDIARYITTGDHLPVALITRRIAPYRSQHVRKRPFQNQPPSHSSRR